MQRVHSPPSGGALGLRYMRLMRASTGMMGMWPPRTRRLSFRKQYFLVILSMITWLGEVLYIRNNINTATFLELGHCYITTLISIVDSHRLGLPLFHKGYEDLIRSFIEDMHLIHFKHRSEYAMEVYLSIDRLCRVFTYALHIQMVTAAMMFNTPPLLYNLRAGLEFPAPPGRHYQLSIYYALPFDYQGSIGAFIVVNIYNIFLSLLVAFFFVIIDLLISLLVFHTWGHLKILHHNIRSFPLPAARDDGLAPAMYTLEESQHILQLLKDNIDYHRQIVEFVDKCTEVFGPMLFLYSAFHQVCLCILLLECSTMESAALIEYLPLTMVLVEQLTLLNSVFELLGTQSELLPDAVYSMPWERMRTRERRVLLLLLQRTQTPVRLFALGVVPVGINTAFTILKRSLSYFFMLQTMSQHN